MAKSYALLLTEFVTLPMLKALLSREVEGSAL